MNQLIAKPRCLDAIDGVIYRRHLDKPSTVELPDHLQHTNGRAIELIAQGQRPDGQIALLQLQPSASDDPAGQHEPLACALPVEFMQSLAAGTELKLLAKIDGQEQASTSLRISDKQDLPGIGYGPLLEILNYTPEKVTIGWTPILGAFDYQVVLTGNGNSREYVTKWTFMDIDISDSEVNTKFTVRVRARVAWWFYTEYSNSRHFSSKTDLRAPQNLKVVVVTDHQAKIAWEAPDECGLIDAYEVSTGNAPPIRTKELSCIVPGLLPEIDNSVSVRIVQGAAYMPSASVLVRLRDNEPPLRSKSYRYEMISANQALFSWKNGDNDRVHHYEVTRNDSQPSYQSAPSYLVSNVQPEQSDTFTVTAIDGSTNRSLTSTTTMAAKWYLPDMPLLAEPEVGYGRITLSWAAQPGVLFEITYYVLDDEKEIVTTRETSIYLRNLLEGAFYYVEVRAINANDQRSDPARFETLIPEQPVPLMPVINASYGPENFGVDLEYATASADRYTIRHWLKNTDTKIEIVTRETTHTLKPLIVGATYTIEIIAFNESGSSETASYTFTMPGHLSLVQPLVHIANNSPGSFILAWTRLFEYNAIEMICRTAADHQEVARFITMDDYYEFTDLEPGVEYLVEVRRSNQNGLSPAHNMLVTGGRVHPRAPRYLRIVSPPQAPNLSLNWSTPADGTPDWITVGDSGRLHVIGGDEVSWTSDVHSPDVEHLVFVSAVWDNLPYVAAVPVLRAEPIPLQPQPQAVGMEIDSVTLKWDAEAGVEYEVYCRSNLPIKAPLIKTPYNYCTFNGLRPGNTYQFEVNAYKNGVAGKPGTVSVRLYDRAVPDTPTVSLVEKSYDSITLQFPALFAEDYLITYSAEGGEQQSITTATPSCLFENLEPAVVYSFNITARNSIGKSETANFKALTTWMAPVVHVVTEMPTLQIAWQSENADKYELTWGTDAGETFGPSELGETILNIENPLPHTTYWFHIRAYNAQVDCWSAMSEFSYIQGWAQPPSFRTLELNQELLSVAWKSKDADKYEVCWGVVGGAEHGPAEQTSNTLNIPNPALCQTYWFKVRAYAAETDAWGPWGEYRAAVVVLPAQLRYITPQMVGLGWTPVPGIVSYSITYGVVGSAEVGTTVTTSHSVYHFDNLIEGTEYYFDLVYIMPELEAPAPRLTATPHAVNTHPPQNLKLLSSTADSVTVGWDKDGPNIYTIQLGEDPSFNATTVQHSYTILSTSKDLIVLVSSNRNLIEPFECTSVLRIIR